MDILENHDLNNGLFLFLSYQAVHDPFSDVEFTDGVPDSYIDSDVLRSIKNTVIGLRRQEYMKSLYLLDQSINMIYNRLIDNDMINNTFIIFISDNGGCPFGGGKNGPYRGSKGSLFEGGIKTTSFIYNPLLNLEINQVYESNSLIYDKLFHISDWFPTILTLADIDYVPKVHDQDGLLDHSSNTLDGSDHVASWFDTTIIPREAMLYNMYVSLSDNDFDIWTDGSFAVRDDRFKLMHTYDDQFYGIWIYPDTPLVIDDDLQADTRCAQQFLRGKFKVSLNILILILFIIIPFNQYSTGCLI